MDEIKKGLETYISFWKNGIENRGEQYWDPKLLY